MIPTRGNRNFMSTGRETRKSAAANTKPPSKHQHLNLLIGRTLKPRAIAHVSGNPNLKAGDQFQTKQEFQLRVPEICNNLHRIPRRKRSKTDPLDARAGTSIGYLCARSWSQSHDFVARVSLTKGIWTCKKASITEVSRRTSIDASARRSCPFTAQHLSRLFSRSFARIRRLEQTQYELS